MITIEIGKTKSITLSFEVLWKEEFYNIDLKIEKYKGVDADEKPIYEDDNYKILISQGKKCIAMAEFDSTENMKYETLRIFVKMNKQKFNKIMSLFVSDEIMNIMDDYN
jgi:hypothetical protein